MTPRSATPLFSREIADLLMAEHVLLWTTRMWRRQRTVEAQVAEFLHRILGGTGVDEAMGAICVLRESLLEHPPMLGAIGVSEAEESLLAHCWAAQTGDDDAADITAVETFQRGARSRARIAAGLLGHMLAENGLGLPCPPRFEASQTFSGIELPFEPLLARLTSGERLIVRSTRLWIGASRMQACCLTQAAAMMRRHGVPASAAGALNHILLVTLGASSRSIEIHALPCANVTRDEGRLLAALAPSAHGPAEMAAIDWLPPAGLRNIQSALESLARSVAGAGLALPRRRRHEPDKINPSLTTWLVAE